MPSSVVVYLVVAAFMAFCAAFSVTRSQKMGSEPWDPGGCTCLAVPLLIGLVILIKSAGIEPRDFLGEVVLALLGGGVLGLFAGSAKARR